MPDIVLDVPLAYIMLDRFIERCGRAGFLTDKVIKNMPSRFVLEISRFFLNFICHHFVYVVRRKSHIVYNVLVNFALFHESLPRKCRNKNDFSHLTFHFSYIFLQVIFSILYELISLNENHKMKHQQQSLLIRLFVYYFTLNSYASIIIMSVLRFHCLSCKNATY